MPDAVARWRVSRDPAVLRPEVQAERVPRAAGRSCHPQGHDRDRGPVGALRHRQDPVRPRLPGRGHLARVRHLRQEEAPRHAASAQEVAPALPRRFSHGTAVFFCKTIILTKRFRNANISC